MASVSGTKVVTNGLVLHFDQDNLKKSFKGKPVTNLMGSDYNATNTSHQNNRPFSALPHSNTNAITSEIKPPVSGLDVYKVTDTGADTQNARYSIKVDCTNSWMSYDSQYIWSMYIWLPSQFDYLYNRSNPFSNGIFQNTNGTDWHGTRGYDSTYNYYGAGSITVTSANGSSSSSIDFTKLDQWQRIWVSFKPLSANVQLAENSGNDNNKWVAGYLRANLTDTDTEYYFYLSGGQLEQSDQVTPFAFNQRTSSQAVLDLTGQQTMTVSSLTYNTDDTFEFDPNDEILVSHSSTLQPTDAYTSDMWVWADQTQDNSFPRIWDKSYILVHITQTSPFTIAQNTTTAGGLRQVAQSSLFNHSTWTHIATSYDGQVGRIYVNGTQVVSNDFGSSANVSSSTGDMGIGGSDGATTRQFKGKIDNLRFYTRALSASEIKTNFEAMRSRYGV